MQDSKHELDSARLSTTDNSARSELTEQYNDLPNFNQDESCVTCRSTEAPPEDDLLTQHEALLYTSAKPSSPRGSRSEKGGNAVPRSIQVFVRVRPLSTKNGEENPVVKLGDENNVLRVLSPCNNQANNCIVTECGFDKVFMDSSTQEDIFCAVEPGLRASLQGYNATIFAYGQTGTGKTHTIFGEDADTIPTNEELQLSPWRPAWGIIPRAVSFLLRQVDELKKQDVDVELQCSFMQIYNDRVFDLLTDRRRQRPLIIREQPAWEGGTNVVLQGLSSERISALDDALRILHRGRTNRSVRETEANSCSSRSHAIVQLNVFTERSLENGDKLIRKSRLNIVDLAGSEKWNTDLEMDDAHSQELKNINTSLSALGNCIAALSEAGRKHIPYRDSTLTRLLQDSFGGNTQACLIATISPSSRACEETIRTLQFADRARSIMQSVRVNETLTGTSELQIAKAQITKLRERLESEQRRRHQMRIKEQETAQKEFFEKLQAKEREIQKLSKDNAVYSRWREDDIKKIRELETRVKELEAQVSSKDTANAEPGTKNDVKFSQQLQISNAPLLPAPTKSVHAKKPSFSNGASVRKDDINVQKPYKKILERYALDSEKSIRRSSEHQITGSQSQTVLTPTQRKENNQLNPASQSTNPDLFKKHDAKQQFDLKSFATEQRKVWGSNENRQLVGPDSPEGLPVTLKSPELFYSSPECIANLSTLNFPSLRPTQPVTATPSAFEKQKLAALSGWGSQSQLTQSSSQLRFQAPSSLMQSAVRTEPMTLKEMEADVQNQWKAFASTSHTLSATDLAKERSLPTNTGKYSPALSDSFDKSDVCEKHRLKGCVLCVVKDPRSSSMRAMKSSTEFSVNTIERLDRIKPADATRQGPSQDYGSKDSAGITDKEIVYRRQFVHLASVIQPIWTYRGDVSGKHDEVQSTLRPDTRSSAF
uniref:Kinesin-like protein n=1 Tax=Globisporangium ultimum (strain ATCC 200006 / CBS 805.95 / DAOM BR144) TaxID=431595 RepID=K3WLS8_GLOUD